VRFSRIKAAWPESRAKGQKPAKNGGGNHTRRLEREREREREREMEEYAR